jgi:5,5'-dehydrodivanillate O-demethylase
VETCVWPFSYRQALDNKQDYSHLPFVHRRISEELRHGPSSLNVARRPMRFSTQHVEETDWGFTSRSSHADGVVATEHILMPNAYLHKDRPGSPRTWDPPKGWDNTIRWTVPIDDEHHMDVSLNLSVATEEEAEEYRKRRQGALDKEPAPAMELLKAVLEGRMTPVELAKYDLHGASGNLMNGIARWGQGTIPDRTIEHLGHADGATILYRKIYEREIQALAEGKPIKQWSWPLDLHAVWTVPSPARVGRS